MTTTVTLDGCSEVESLEFVVDDQRLSDWVKWTAGEEFTGCCAGRVSPIGRSFKPKFVRQVHRQLLAQEASDLPGQRVPLYLCPCGDPYCGGLMIQVSRTGDRFTWSGWSGLHADVPGLPALVFDARQYRAALEAARAFF